MTDIINYINNDIKAINIKESVSDVQHFFSELTFSHFPVVEEEVYIGSIESEDIISFDSSKNLADYRYSLDGFFARNNMIWLEVLEVFAKNNTNLVPVLDETNKYIGYYEINDIMRFFNDTPFLKEKGEIIIVKKRTLDFSISQIAQIIESNNGQILGLFISDSDVDFSQITIKMSLGVVNEIIQSLRRYDYEIISEHNEDNYINTLKERSDYLDKYLNI
ncbi:CBS domain-containing protein [Flavobacterium cellulosilyticum]|uniref:CBS domain-containing protein n=1 Tax=Flavobacterium cellulosilyticum TaxID=2541731 RepID=A0A4R5CDW0_9FLAO|nr:CBS domain-containing protein [Flavobacterium cellulosilyticum]TDD96500.1 CBS domain-containing protein [Flavobacterium cellulosilyticum]